MFADLRAKKTLDWISKNTAGATFCKRSDEVKDVKGGKVLLYFIARNRDQNMSDRS